MFRFRRFTFIAIIKLLPISHLYKFTKKKKTTKLVHRKSKTINMKIIIKDNNNNNNKMKRKSSKITHSNFESVI